MSEEIKEDSDSSSKRGFAAHPQNINRGGRPKGSRNKSTLLRAQLNIDDMSLQATEILQALMMNDKEFLETSADVSPTIRLSAAKEILAKAIANEKDKEPTETPKGVNTEEEDLPPVFSAIPVKSA